jgi:hypothetical protein
MMRIALARMMVLTFLVSLVLVMSCKRPEETPAKSQQKDTAVQSEQQPSRETVEPLIAAKGLGVPTPESIKYPDDEPPLGEEI